MQTYFVQHGMLENDTIKRQATGSTVINNSQTNVLVAYIILMILLCQL